MPWTCYHRAHVQALSGTAMHSARCCARAGTASLGACMHAWQAQDGLREGGSMEGGGMSPYSDTLAGGFRSCSISAAS